MAHAVAERLEERENVDVQLDMHSCGGSVNAVNTALGDLIIGERVRADTYQNTVTGRVAEVVDGHLWLFDHDCENIHH